jgi:hypothetical protein
MVKARGLRDVGQGSLKLLTAFMGLNVLGGRTESCTAEESMKASKAIVDGSNNIAEHVS